MQGASPCVPGVMLLARTVLWVVQAQTSEGNVHCRNGFQRARLFTKQETQKLETENLNSNKGIATSNKMLL